MSGVYVVELDENLTSVAGYLFVVEIGDTFRFSLHPCHAPLVASKVIPPASIVCDDLQKAVTFQLDCGIAYLAVDTTSPGPLTVTIAVPVEVHGSTSWTRATFTVLVQPTLQGSDRKSLKHMLLQTQITRLLGPLDAWAPAFEAIAAGGYNTVYLTPVQLLSPTSGSAFCVADQLQLGLSLFDGNSAALTHDCALEKLEAVIVSCSRRLQLTFVTDIVLNHMALDSPFILQHPEAAYNLNNSPHLRAAALLDLSLHAFGRRVLDGEFVASGLAPVVCDAADAFNFDTYADISKFVNVFFNQVLLWAFARCFYNICRQVAVSLPCP
jgi:hypothetical protein